MSSRWYCMLEGKELGPFSSSELRGLVAEGRLRPEDTIRRGDQAKWTSARHVKGLFADVAEHPPAPPPLPSTSPEEKTGDSFLELSAIQEPEATPRPVEEETVLPVIHMETTRDYGLSSEPGDRMQFSRRRQQQKKTQILALVLLGGVLILGVLLILVLTGILGPSRSTPKTSGQPAVRNGDGSPQSDIPPEEVEAK
jgi:hypothetical protein